MYCPRICVYKAKKVEKKNPFDTNIVLYNFFSEKDIELLDELEKRIRFVFKCNENYMTNID